MARQVKPSDVTGRAREKMISENQEALQARASEMSMASAEASKHVAQHLQEKGYLAGVI